MLIPLAAVLIAYCLIQTRPGLSGQHDDRITRRRHQYDRLFARAAERDPQQNFKLLTCAAAAALLALYDLLAFTG